MSWEPQSLTGWIENIATMEAQTIDVFRRERYLSGLPENPFLKLYGYSVRSIMPEDLQPILRNVVGAIPEQEVPEWLKSGIILSATFSAMASTVNNNRGELYVSSGDPWIPGLRARTARVLPIGADDIRRRGCQFDVDEETGRRVWRCEPLYEPFDQIGIGGGEEVRNNKIYDFVATDLFTYAKQWNLSVLEWLRLPTVTPRESEFENIVAPEARLRGFNITLPLHLGALPGGNTGAVELGIESPESQRIRITLRDLNDFTRVLGRGEIQMGSFRRIRIRSRGLFARLPPMAISLYPQRQMKVQYVRLLPWWQALF